MDKQSNACVQAKVKLTTSDLSAGRLCCPRPDQLLWNAHPRVYLPIQLEKSCVCPYCGTQYDLVDD